MREGHFGRCWAVALRALKRRATAGPVQCWMGEDLKRGLEWLAAFLPTAQPRVLLAHPSNDTIHIFTDGACEGTGTTVGATIFINGALPEYLAEEVPAG